MNVRRAAVGVSGERRAQGCLRERARRDAHPHISPIRRISIVSVIVSLVLPRHRLVDIDPRASLHLVDRERDIEVSEVPIGTAERNERDEHLAAFEEARANHERADCPVDVVQKEVDDLADLAVRRRNRVTLELFQTSQHGPTGCTIGARHIARSAAGWVDLARHGPLRPRARAQIRGRRIVCDRQARRVARLRRMRIGIGIAR